MKYRPGNESRNFFRAVKLPLAPMPVYAEHVYMCSVILSFESPNPSNLKHWIAKEPTMVPFSICEYRDGDWQIGELAVPALDVHELLAYIHEALRIQCPEEDVQRFWKHLTASRQRDPHTFWTVRGRMCPRRSQGQSDCDFPTAHAI